MYRESLGDHFSLYIFCYSPTLHIRDFHVRYTRTPSFLLGVYSVCVHYDSVFCACTLCFSTSSFFLFLKHTSCVFFLCIHACTPMCYIIPHHPFGGLYIWRSLYIWRNISIWRVLSVLRAPSSFLFFPAAFPSSKALITLTLGYQLRQK